MYQQSRTPYNRQQYYSRPTGQSTSTSTEIHDSFATLPFDQYQPYNPPNILQQPFSRPLDLPLDFVDVPDQSTDEVVYLGRDTIIQEIEDRSSVQIPSFSSGQGGYNNPFDTQPLASSSQLLEPSAKKGASRKVIVAAKQARKGNKGRSLRHDEGIDPSTALEASQSIVQSHLRAKGTKKVYQGYMKRCRTWLDLFNKTRQPGDPNLEGALDVLSERSARCVHLFIAHGVSGKNGTKPHSKDTCDGIKAALRAYFQETFGNQCYVSERSCIFIEFRADIVNCNDASSGRILAPARERIVAWEPCVRW